MVTSVAVAVASGVMAETSLAMLAAGTIGFSWSAFASSLILSGLSAAMRPDAPSQSGGVSNPERTVTMRKAISPWRVIYGRTRVGGVVTYKKITANHQWYHMVVTLAGHVSEEIETVYFNDEEVTLDADGYATGRFAGHCRIQKSLGDETGQPFPNLVELTDGEWSDAHRQTGFTKMRVSVLASNTVFPNGLPNITAVVKGKNDIYDPRSGLTGWSDNPALCTVNYLTDTVRGLGAVYADEINATELAAAANVCDESVTLADGSSESRYTCNGSFTLSEKPADIIPRLASSMAGYVTQIGATWSVIAGAYDTPTLTLTESHLAGPIGFTALVSRRENANGVKGVYVEPGNLWQPADFPAVISDTARAEDGGEAVWHDLRLDYTDSGTMAQRIAKIDLLRTRQPLSVSFPGRLSCFRAQPGKTVMLTIAKYGWSAKPFFVAGGSFAVNKDGTLGYHLTLRETAAAIYDWTTDEEQAIDLAPNTTLDDPFAIAAPGTPDVAESLYETTGSAGVKARATMSWAAVDDGFLLDYLPEYRIAAGTWVALPPTTDTAADIDDVAPGDYEFRVRARSTVLALSDYSGTRAKEILGLTAAPADVAGFSVIKLGGVALAAWTLHTDLDVRQGGAIVVRHSPASSGAAWEDGIIVDEFAGASIGGALALMSGTYLVKARDSSGNWSSAAASFTATEGMVTGWVTAGSVTLSPDFAGSLTDVGVVDGTLRLVSAEDWDAAETLDADDDVDGGAIAASGSALFTDVLDLGTVAVRRVQVAIDASSYDVADYIDGADDIDSAEDIDGAAINDCDATFYAATTPDDPAGSPTWSDWSPFFTADFEARALKFRIDLSSGNASHTIAVQSLTVTALDPA